MDARDETFPAGPERRQHKRIRILLTGNVSLGGRVKDCTILDVSLSGARICLPQPPAYREAGTLELSRFGGFRAEVAWRHKEQAGLRFMDGPGHTAAVLTGFLPEACLA